MFKIKLTNHGPVRKDLLLTIFLAWTIPLTLLEIGVRADYAFLAGSWLPISALIWQWSKVKSFQIFPTVSLTLLILASVLVLDLLQATLRGFLSLNEFAEAQIPLVQGLLALLIIAGALVYALLAIARLSHLILYKGWVKSPTK